MNTNKDWKLVPPSLHSLILTGDLEALLWQLKGVREAEEVRMALYNARKAILDAEEYADCNTASTVATEGEKDEQAAFERWLDRTSPSGDVEAVQRQWEASSDYADLHAPAAGDAEVKS